MELCTGFIIHKLELPWHDRTCHFTGLVIDLKSYSSFVLFYLFLNLLQAYFPSIGTYALHADIKQSPSGFSTTSTVNYQPISRSGTLSFSYIADTYSESRQRNTDYLNITTCRGVMNNYSGIWTSKDFRSTSVAFNCSSAENVHVSETHTVCQSLRRIDYKWRLEYMDNNR